MEKDLPSRITDHEQTTKQPRAKSTRGLSSTDDESLVVHGSGVPVAVDHVGKELNGPSWARTMFAMRSELGEGETSSLARLLAREETTEIIRNEQQRIT